MRAITLTMVTLALLYGAMMAVNANTAMHTLDGLFSDIASVSQRVTR